MHNPKGLRFFLDSGAYSAWSVGKGVDIDQYIEFIRHNIEVIDVYPCLDVIPGKPGQNATHREREEAAAATWENYLYMKSEGLDPIPVYHYGESAKWLTNMLDHKVGYIGIGGLVGIPGDKRRLWLDRVFTMICDESGQPKVKTHGFGMTSIPLIFRYPWYSVDSTSWIKVSQFGGVYLPRIDKKGEFQFDETPEVIAVSQDSPNRNVEGKHVNTLGPSTKAHLERWLAICGTDIGHVAINYYYRALVNATFFRMVGEKRQSIAFKRPVSNKGLFY